MKHLFLLFLFLPLVGLTQNEWTESDILAWKGWELIKVYDDIYEKVDEKRVKEALVYFDKALSLNKKNYNAMVGKAAVYDYLSDYSRSLKYYKDAFKIDSSEILGISQRAITYLHMGDTASCFQDYRTAKIKWPKNYNIDVGLGNTFMMQKEYAKAIYYYTGAINEGIKTVMVFHNRAMAYKSFGYGQLAIRDMERAISMDSTVNSTLILRGKMHMDTGNYKDAIKDLKRALKIDSTSFQARLSLANCFEDMGQPEIAEVEYKKLTIFHPLQTVPFFNLGVLYKRKDPVKAIECFDRAIGINKNDPKPYYEKGVIYYDYDKLNEAVMEFEKALTVDPLYFDAYNGLGNVNLKKREYAKAFKDYEKSVQMNPKFSIGITNMGRALSYLNRKNEACFAFKKAMFVDSSYAYSYYHLGDMFLDFAKPDSAILYYSKAIKFKPDFVDAYYNIGRINEFIKHNNEVALENFNKCITIDSLYYPAINSRGNLHAKLGNFELAEMDLLRCITIAPKSFSYPYNNLANCYLKMNRLSEACKYWRLAIEHGYRYQAKWKQDGIDDPSELIKKYCQ